MRNCVSLNYSGCAHRTQLMLNGDSLIKKLYTEYSPRGNGNHLWTTLGIFFLRLMEKSLYGIPKMTLPPHAESSQWRATLANLVCCTQASHNFDVADSASFEQLAATDVFYWFEVCAMCHVECVRSSMCRSMSGGFPLFHRSTSMVSSELLTEII